MHSGDKRWRTIRLADAGLWLSGGTPSTANHRYWDGDIPWISAASMKKFNIRDSERRITRLAATVGSRLVPRDAVILVVRGMSLKSEFRVGVTREEVAFGQDCKAIIPVADIDARFLAYSLKARSERVLRMVDEAGHGTGRLPTDQLSELRIEVPALHEQRRIIEILDAADESIRSVERLITKSKQFQFGVMNNLFARLKASRHERCRGDEIFRLSGGYIPPFLRTDGAGSVLYLKVDDFNNPANHNGLVNAELTFDARHARPRLTYGPGAVVFPKRGVAILKNRVGTLAARATVDPNLMVLICSPQLVPEWFARYLRWLNLANMCDNSGVPQLNNKHLYPLTFVVPPIPEQLRINAVLDSSGAHLRAAYEHLDKLKKIRLSLADDLLSGQVRKCTGKGSSG